jgi:phospholipid/cholesterol/gamma-HCH transport system substrate-binding protein
MKVAMRRNLIETALGVVVLAAAALFLTIILKTVDNGGGAGYQMTAEFNRIGSLKVGNDIRVSGVPVGEVISIGLDEETFKAKIKFNVSIAYKFPVDTVAVIGSEGLLGGNFIELIPGGSPDELVPGDTLEFSQDAVDISGLLGKFMFSTAADKDRNR